MSEKHTPGPWDIEHQSDVWFCETNHAARVVSKNSPTFYIASIEGLGVESGANANLIAAAPDLLEACEALLEEVNYQRSLGEFSAKLSVKEQCRKAIAKAKGES